MKKYLVLTILMLLIVACGSPPSDCPSCPEQETIIETVEKIVEVPEECPICEIECPELPDLVCPELQCQECPTCDASLGPWTIMQTIMINGQYLVPEEAQPGQWSYISYDEGDTCWADTYSDLSGEYDSRLDKFYSENKGFFILKENVRMVEFRHGPCMYTRVGD